MGLVREIMLCIEDERQLSQLSTPWPIINKHLVLLIQVGFLEGDISSTTEGTHAYIREITWAGHDYLAAVRDDGIWRALVKKAGPLFGNMSLVMIKEMGQQLIRGHLFDGPALPETPPTIEA